MTLKQVIQGVEIAAMQQPSVNMIVQNDVFRINSAPSLKYGVFAWTQGQHSGNIQSGINSYQFTFFYVDRLKADLSNQIEIQSVGVDTIGNILRLMESMGIFPADTYSIQPFNQRFTDECAGVFCNVTIEVPANTICPESFADFARDINDDLIIY